MELGVMKIQELIIISFAYGIGYDKDTGANDYLTF